MKNLVLVLLLFSSQIVRGQHWNRMYSFSSDTTISSGNSAQYAEDSFFIAAGQCSNFTVDSLNTYLAIFDYNFNLRYKKLLYWPGMYNRLAGG